MKDINKRAHGRWWDTLTLTEVLVLRENENITSMVFEYNSQGMIRHKGRPRTIWWISLRVGGSKSGKTWS